MKRILLIYAVTVCMCIPALLAQDATVKKIIEIGQTDNQTMRHLDILTNRFGGRLVGSDAYENAAEWMVREYKSWGLDVEIEEAGSVPVGFNRGPWFGRMLSDNGMNLHFATPSYTSGTKGLQRGHVLIEPRTQEEFNRIKGKLNGAWVLISGKNTGWPIDRSVSGDSTRAVIKAENAEITLKNRDLSRRNMQQGENNELQPYREFPALFYHEMCEAGALGFIQSSTVPIRALYDRKMLNEGMTFDELPELPDIKLDEHQFAIIEQMVKERREFQLEFDIRNHFKIGPVKYHNIIASIKGTEFPDEYVIISGHLDAFDVATGGVDCGTGIAPMMEVARILAKSGAKPKRTILFIAFAAEEFGLLGAKAFVKRHPDRLTKIANVFNRDGGPVPPVSITVPPAVYEDFKKFCEPIKQIRPDYPFEVILQKEPRTKPAQPGSHDGTVFAVEGVPTIYFETADFKGYDFNYGEIWHTERDLYTKNIPEYQEHTSTVTAIVALGIANMKKLMSREGVYK
ncbi:M20/M25/M40 family metallo-hydrolase [Parabacteroides sp. PF5-9]|uniref:M20/M25/M40 family metallo-hydrolase n=1 Tax=Parabacteroides sp. PF5-9 TaxID=1742404 RepID=UPI0024760397|nr:M20/M25/M40 family metallo-hydrolase [Parabacteroides sp. PF5-9]MDH6356454.1 carboxypeptidase Q [Parabacteroides sp. PF5-9]